MNTERLYIEPGDFVFDHNIIYGDFESRPPLIELHSDNRLKIHFERMRIQPIEEHEKERVALTGELKEARADVEYLIKRIADTELSAADWKRRYEELEETIGSISVEPTGRRDGR